MPEPTTALRTARRELSRPARAGLVCTALAAIALTSGCFDQLSLGSGLGEGGSGGGAITTVTIAVVSSSSGEPIDVTFSTSGCHPGLTTDLDGDGWTPAQGDCNDCDPDMGPSAVEMPTEDGETAKDENCDGHTDEPQPTCDVGIGVDDANPYAAARALDLCATASAGIWGVTKASWVLPDGSPPPTSWKFAVGHGILDRFGPNVTVRHGNRMLALSTGTARQPSDPGWVDPDGFEKGFTSKPPEGFPKESPGCPGVESGAPYDGAGLELVIRVPQNAEAFAFDFDFYTHEFPQSVCSAFDDLFVALVSPTPSGQSDGNVAFDALGNTVNVNSVFLDACSCDSGPPCLAGGRDYACSLGPSQLIGTGFGADTDHDGDRGATGWLTSMADVERGSAMTIRFAIQDSGDGGSDSTVLIDHFRWLRHEPLVARTARE